MPPPPFPVLWQDEHAFAINKPAGRICEGPHHADQPCSLEEELQQHGLRAYAIHRLDVDTTGVLLFARTKPALTKFQTLFATKHLRKSYLAVVKGKWPASTNRVDAPLRRNPVSHCMEIHPEGKNALTTFRVLATNQDRSLIEALLKTGRTHQIRVHCHHVGHPILGDRLYGEAELADNGSPIPQALHAHRIQFRHPFSGEDIKLTCPLPDYWQTHWLQGLDWKESS